MNNPLGVSDFLEQISEQDYELLKEVNHLVEQLTRSLNPASVRQVTPASSNCRLITIAVDGGSSLLFPQFREISLGMIRVSAFGSDLEEQPEPVVKVIKNYELFDILKTQGENAGRLLRAKRREFVESLFREPPLQEFSAETGINYEDLGEYVYRDLESFTNVLRSILEWAYIVALAKKYKDAGIKVVLVRDGRLEQHGVRNSFIEKLKEHFATRQTRIVGVVKSTKLLREGIPSLVILRWMSQHVKGNPVYFRVPDELMRYTFGFERQWNPDYHESFVFGYRYIGKFYPETYSPLQSVITFDVPFYFAEDQQFIEDIVSTLYNHRSVLHDGSISTISEAHERASIDSAVVNLIENELRHQIQQKTGLCIPAIGR
ncbi:MAG: hypothetical protein NZ874_01670 [Fimbriimonadales bacterium]|nr:hypothetical protein [Fimbriimonadales bacterium]